MLKSLCALAVSSCILMIADANASANVDPAAAADLLLHNGRIYTQNTDTPWVEAVAVRNGKIVALGSNDEMQGFKGAQTQVLDLEGRMAMPGLIDAHVHPTWGALKNLYQCNFAFTATPDELAKAISACVKQNPDSDWIRGGQWTSGFFKTNAIASPRAWLDQVSGGKAVVLTDDTGHNVWVNSEALKRLGIDANTKAPAGVEFVRDPSTGELNGLIMEGNGFVKTVMPDWTDAQYLEAVRYAVARANSFGITGLKDADASEAVVKAYHAVDTATGLNAHVATSMRRPGKEAKNTFDMPEFVRMRDTYASPHLNTSNIKIYLDGVPTSAQTAAMLEPYAGDGHGHGEESSTGTLLVKPEELDAVMTQMDALGFTVKVHAAGDRAIRVALDAIEAARNKNGASGHHHELAHAEYVDPKDLPRFAKLGAVADFAPYIWYPSPIQTAIGSAVGERAQKAFPSRDLLDSGARIIAGSDWPSAVADITPWPGMEALITRQSPDGKTHGALWPEQAIRLEEALSIFTRNGAEALGAGDRAGSIEVGKSADIIVLDRNLFEIPVEQISDTQVLTTFFEGRKVYQRE